MPEYTRTDESDADVIERHAAQAQRKLEEVEEHLRYLGQVGYHTPDRHAFDYARTSLAGLRSITRRAHATAKDAHALVVSARDRHRL